MCLQYTAEDLKLPSAVSLCETFALTKKKVTPTQISSKSSTRFEVRLWGGERTGLELDQGRLSVFQGNAQGKGKSHAKENNVTGQ